MIKAKINISIIKETNNKLEKIDHMIIKNLKSPKYLTGINNSK